MSVFLHECVFMYKCFCLSECVSVFVCVSVSVCMYMYVGASMWVHLCGCTYVYVYVGCDMMYLNFNSHDSSQSLSSRHKPLYSLEPICTDAVLVTETCHLFKP